MYIEKYTKCDLLVSREDAVKLEPGEYFICDLIGLDVITDEGKHLGVLKDVLETGANNVYEVEADNARLKIHFLYYLLISRSPGKMWTVIVFLSRS